MNHQLSFTLSDEVAPYFERPIIKQLCTLIDEKMSKGFLYYDLLAQLLSFMAEDPKITGPDTDPEANQKRRAYEFARHYGKSVFGNV